MILNPLSFQYHLIEICSIRSGFQFPDCYHHCQLYDLSKQLGSMMDFDNVFAFFSEDEDWAKKVGIAAVLILTQIGSIAVMGWSAEIAKRIANNQPDPIPEWDDLGTYFSTGFKLIGASFVWFLPPAMLVICQSAVMIFALQEGDTLAALLTASSVIVYLLVFLYIIVGGLLFSPLYVLAAEQVEFKQLIKPSPAWKLFRANFGGYILAILVGSLLSLVLVSTGLLVCFVGSFFGAALGFTFLGILIGQATRNAREIVSLVAENQPESM